MDKQEFIETLPPQPSIQQQDAAVQSQLKSCSYYTLVELQELAKHHNIDIKKTGKTGNNINKTKQELYNELIKIMN